MMDLNFSPMLTTRNYGINCAKIDDNIFCDQISNFTNVKIENGETFLKKTSKIATFSNRIGEKFDNQLKNENNLNLHFVVKKSKEKPIFLNFDFDKTNPTLVENVLFEIEKEENAKVVISYKSSEKAYHNGFVRFVCKEGSKVEVVLISDLSEMSVNILRVESLVERDATINFNIVDFGGAVDIQNYYAKLEGEHAFSTLNCLYVAGGESFVDLNFEQDVFGQKSKAEIETIGALMGNAKKHFKGTINFEKGCKKSVGIEDELCLLLSKTAKSKALPMLLCTEEDVDGKHSSSVGKVDENELFYIMSRGFSFEEARKLVVKAKFDVVLRKISDEKLRDELIEIVDGKLSYEEN